MLGSKRHVNRGNGGDQNLTACAISRFLKQSFISDCTDVYRLNEMYFMLFEQVAEVLRDWGFTSDG